MSHLQLRMIDSSFEGTKNLTEISLALVALDKITSLVSH